MATGYVPPFFVKNAHTNGLQANLKSVRCNISFNIQDRFLGIQADFFPQYPAFWALVPLPPSASSSETIAFQVPIPHWGDSVSWTLRFALHLPCVKLNRYCGCTCALAHVSLAVTSGGEPTWFAWCPRPLEVTPNALRLLHSKAIFGRCNSGLCKRGYACPRKWQTLSENQQWVSTNTSCKEG